MTDDAQKSHASHELTTSDANVERNAPALAESATQNPVTAELAESRSTPIFNPDKLSSEKLTASSQQTAEHAHLIGEPDTLPLTFCKRCKVDVKPEGKGLCPQCGKMLRHNFLARKHPVNVLRRDQLHAEIVLEYKPSTLELRDACRFLANVKERLDRAKDGSAEHQRLMAMWRDLSIQLRTATRAYATSSAADLAQLSTQEQADRASAIAQRLQARADAEAESRTYLASVAGRPVTRVDDEPFSSETLTTALAPSALERCPYGCGSLEKCTELRTTRPEVWETLHARDPEVVTKKDEAATAEMIESLRRHGRASY